MDWGAHSPVVAAVVHAARQLAQRRNSSLPPLPKFEPECMRYHNAVVNFNGTYLSSAVVEDDNAKVQVLEEMRRGRGQVNELDPTPFGVGGNRVQQDPKRENIAGSMSKPSAWGPE